VRKLYQCFRRLSALRKPVARRYWIVAADPNKISLPAPCACCLAPAFTSQREIGSVRDNCVIVPYCSACLRHAARPRLFGLASTYGSFLLAVFCGVLLAATWDSRWGTTLCATALATLPIWWLRWLNLPRQLGHAARGQALRVLPQGLACASEQYARLASRDLGVVPRLEVGRMVRWRAGDFLGPMLAMMLTPYLHHLFFPVLRVLNFTDRSIQVMVDNRKLGFVEPTSGESPSAGEMMRAPSGKHRLMALYADGTRASEIQVEIRSGFQHLYAPGAAPDCFYLQRVAYGRSQFEGEKLTTLTSASRFWVVGSDVDLWFTPGKALRSGGTTGGVVTLLRMGNCR
jgi:hypothetical protein